MRLRIIGVTVVCVVAASQLGCAHGHYGHIGGGGVAGLDALLAVGELAVDIAEMSTLAQAQSSPDGRCGDSSDCGAGQRCMGAPGDSIGHCVAEEREVERAADRRPDLRTEALCDPTQDPAWHGATDEEKERIYQSCVAAPRKTPDL